MPTALKPGDRVTITGAGRTGSLNSSVCLSSIVFSLAGFTTHPAKAVDCLLSIPLAD